MKTIETQVFEFSELSEEAREKARQWYREGALDYEWYDAVYEDATTIAGLMGVEIERIYFSGFYSQGDGACFSGTFAYKAGAVEAVKAYAPLDADLHDLVERWESANAANKFLASGNVTHDGHYYHQNCTRWAFENTRDTSSETALELVLKDFMRWIYSQLTKEYEYLTSAESVDENIILNEYTFTADGHRFG